MTKKKAKELVIIVFKNEYGFAPNKKDIIDLEIEESPKDARIEVEINGCGYRIKIPIDWIANNSETKARMYYNLRCCEVEQMYNSLKW